MITHPVTERELIRLESTPASAPYSAAVALTDLVWTSGALPVEADGSVSDDFQTQVRTALRNLESYLTAAGADWSTVLKINGYVSDIERLPELNEVYSSVVTPAGAPARTTVRSPASAARRWWSSTPSHTGGTRDPTAPQWAGRNRSVKITVIGAGVIGLACAYELSELGHVVTVIDAGSAGAAASAGNAGWITPFLSTPRAAPGAVRDAVRSFTSTEGPARMRPHLEGGFASWVTQFLRASTRKRSARATEALQAFARHAHEHVDSLLDRGVAFEHHTDGLAVVFKEAKNLEHYEVAQKMRSLGYVGEIGVHRGSDVAAFDPAIRRDIAGVMHLESERHVRPESLCEGLAKAVKANGGQLLEHDPVVRIGRKGATQWTVETSEGHRLVADRVVSPRVTRAGPSSSRSA